MTLSKDLSSNISKTRCSTNSKTKLFLRSTAAKRLAFTTDSYVVDPIFFPGGDIGALAVHGTVNDLAMSGARPLYLSVGLIIEEGFPIDDLKRILGSMKTAAEEAGVQIVTGDTKVVQKGSADKIFINTAGIGTLETDADISASRSRPGDKVIVSGSIGDHGTTIMIARGELDLETDIESDTASLYSLVADMLDEAAKLNCLDAIHTLRDTDSRRCSDDPERDRDELGHLHRDRRSPDPGP